LPAPFKGWANQKKKLIRWDACARFAVPALAADSRQIHEFTEHDPLRHYSMVSASNRNAREDVPVVFSRDTIQLAATSFLTGATMTQSSALGSDYAQLFCFLASDVLHAELANGSVGTAEIMEDFHGRLSRSVPDDLRREFLAAWRGRPPQRGMPSLWATVNRMPSASSAMRRIGL